MTPSNPTSEQKTWRCFHCDEVFTDRAAALAHFGPSPFYDPGCTINVAEYRRMEQNHLRHCNEDSELHRLLQAKEADHQVALRREEEKGYERAIRDLASAIQKLAPDLAKDIAERWTKAKAEQNAALAEILAVLRRPEDAISDAR